MSNPPGQPGWGQPPYGEPGPGQPDYNQPGTPNADPPGYGSPYPSYEQPASGQPAYGQEYGQGQPPYGQPDPYATQQYSSSPPPADAGYGQTQALPAYDPGHPGGPAYPGPPGYGAPPPPPKKSNTGLIVGVIIGALVLLLCLGGGLFFFAASTTTDPVASGSPTVTATPTDDATPTDGPSTPEGDKLASRTTDPTPLSLSEFSRSSYSLPSGTFERTGEDESSSCSLAVEGKAKALLRTLDCSQAVSATAVNSDGCVITFGAINLPDEDAATQAATKIGGGDQGSFVPRRHGDPREGEAGNKDWWFYRQAVGHWVIFATGAYANGKKAANDPVISACDRDFLSLMEETIDKRR